MIDPTYTPMIEVLGMVAGLVPIVVLAALAVMDLRAFMLLRAMKMMKRPQRVGETVISGEEWGPVVEGL